MTQRDLARLLDTDPATIARIELGERRVDIVEYFYILEALGAPLKSTTSELMNTLRDN